MLSIKLRKTFSIILGLMLAGVSGIGVAHELIGTLSGTSPSVANAPSNIDVVHTSCASWTSNQDTDGNGQAGVGAGDEYSGAADRFVANIETTLGAGTVRVSIGKVGLAGAGQSVTDALGGVGSAFVGLSNGNGDYVVAVSHSGANTNNYTAAFHCEKSVLPPVILGGPFGGAAALGSGAHTKTGVRAAGGTASNDNVAPGADFNNVLTQ